MAGTGGFRPGAGRPKGATNRSTLEQRNKYGIYDDMPLDNLIYGMRYWRQFCDALIQRQIWEFEQAKKQRECELEQDENVGDDQQPQPVARPDPDEPPKLEITPQLREAFQMLGWFADKATPYLHARIAPAPLGSNLDLRKLSYEDLKTIVPILRKARGIIEPPANGGEPQGSRPDGAGPSGSRP